MALFNYLYVCLDSYEYFLEQILFFPMRAYPSLSIKDDDDMFEMYYTSYSNATSSLTISLLSFFSTLLKAAGGVAFPSGENYVTDCSSAARVVMLLF